MPNQEIPHGPIGGPPRRSKWIATPVSSEIEESYLGNAEHLPQEPAIAETAWYLEEISTWGSGLETSTQLTN